MFNDGVEDPRDFPKVPFVSFRLTTNPLGVIIDVLYTQWGEHHTHGLAWHAHLSTTKEKQAVTYTAFRRESLTLTHN